MLQTEVSESTGKRYDFFCPISWSVIPDTVSLMEVMAYDEHWTVKPKWKSGYILHNFKPFKSESVVGGLQQVSGNSYHLVNSTYTGAKWWYINHSIKKSQFWFRWGNKITSIALIGDHVFLFSLLFLGNHTSHIKNKSTEWSEFERKAVHLTHSVESVCRHFVLHCTVLTKYQDTPNKYLQN